MYVSPFLGWPLPQRKPLLEPWCSLAAKSTCADRLCLIKGYLSLLENQNYCYLGTRTVSILQSSWGSRLQSSVGMFWIRSCCSSRQTCDKKKMNPIATFQILPSWPAGTHNWMEHKSPWDDDCKQVSPIGSGGDWSFMESVNLGILRQAVSGFTFLTFFFSRVHCK